MSLTRVNTDTEAAPSRQTLYGIIFLVAAIGFSGLWLVNKIVWMDVARDNRHWQDKLNLIVESRADEVDKWIAAQSKELRNLSENPSLQLYLTELQVTPAQKSTLHSGEEHAEPAQIGYLRNLLNFTGTRLGVFAGDAQAGAPLIPANVIPQNPAGIAIINDKGETVVSTPMQPLARSVFFQKLQEAPAGKESFFDAQRGDDGKLYIAMAMPVYGLQGNQDEQSGIGRVIAILPLGEALFDLLRHPGVTEKTLEVGLLRNHNGQSQYISPLFDGSKPLEKTIAADSTQWAESFALASPGVFEARLDYRARYVFLTSRRVEGTPWTIIAKIEQDEALAESNARRSSMIAMLLLALLVVVVTIIAVWRQSSLRRSKLLSRRFKLMADRAQAQEQLLRLVTDNQSESVYIIDQEATCQFANQKAGKRFGMDAGSMRGKKATDIMGAARASEIIRSCEESINRAVSVIEMRRDKEAGVEKVIRAEHIPLAHIPVQNLPEGTPGVLVVEQDVTEVVQERERRLHDHQKLIETLIMIVDKRDPNAATHSAQVAFVAGHVAESLQLDPFMRETARLAGSLMNIGKIIIPEQVLTRAEGLNAEEKRSIRESVYASADVLANIPFEGPVVETLRQSQELWDGSGPKGLRGEDILLPARIIAVSNAFVGMISKRAYRDALSSEEAIKLLLDLVDKHYDRRVVVALADYIENKGGKRELESVFGQRRKVA